MSKLTTARCKTYVEAFGYKNPKRTRKVKDDLGVTLRVFTAGDRCFVIESGHDDEHVQDIHPLDVPDVSADDLKDSSRPWLQKTHVGPASSTDLPMTPAEFWALAEQTYREQETTRTEIYFEDKDGVDLLVGALVEHLADGSGITWIREALTTAPDNEGVREYLGSVLCWIDGYADEDEWEAALSALGYLLDGWEW